ncbi:unnamed protein product [Cylicocyclus nassatus]|uniref:Peptidase M13 N-terminal domain-containing protein n=1 Tax=Cylicocyclus nassatus TaxID=53992 RepID=A0AA36DM89_CYLNA|nr:unnamed protein product [Cylicocyclus nassatus]
MVKAHDTYHDILKEHLMTRNIGQGRSVAPSATAQKVVQQAIAAAPPPSEAKAKPPQAEPQSTTSNPQQSSSQQSLDETPQLPSVSTAHFDPEPRSFANREMRWVLLLVLLCWCAPHITLSSEGLENIGSSAGNIASEILINSINFSVNPCEDFFEFSCGNWIAQHPIPKDKVGYSQFEMLSDKVQAQMRDIFESNETFGSKSMNAVKYIYKKCMDKDELNRIGARRVIERIRGFGVWPILEGDENWREEDFDLTSLLIHLKQMRDFDVFVKFGIGPDYKNASRYLITFYQDDPSETLEEYISGRGIEREIHIEEVKLLKELLNLNRSIEDATRMLKAVKNSYISMVELFQRDGDFPINRTKVEKDVEEIMDLEMKMAKILVRKEDRKNYTKYYHLSHLSDMNKLVPLERDKATLGKQQNEPRWMDCTRSTVQLLKYATSAIYVKKAFDQSSKNLTIEMTDDLLETFREILGTNGWMDNGTKAAALDKANQLLSQVAYPEFILDDEKLDQYYDGLDVHYTDSYSEMLEKVERQKIEFWFKMLTKPASHSDLESSSATVAPIYIPTTNSFRIPAAILQAPLFHHTFPRWFLTSSLL